MDSKDRVVRVRDFCYKIVIQAIYDIKSDKTPEDVRKDAKEFFFSAWGADIIKAAGFDMPGGELYWAVKHYVDKQQMERIAKALEDDTREPNE